MSVEKARRKPDYNISAKNMDTGRKGRCGAAWKNEDGSISIVLDPWVVLRGNGYISDTIAIALYPNDGYRADKPAPETKEEQKQTRAVDYPDDDIPF